MVVSGCARVIGCVVDGCFLECYRVGRIHESIGAVYYFGSNALSL